MNLEFSAEDIAFRDEVRQFFATKYPQDVIAKNEAFVELSKDDYVRAQKALHARGWAGPNWPVEYGGTGWSHTQRYIFFKEMGASGAPWVSPFGLMMVAPVIYTFGTTEQKERFLPDILASNVWWCQGYSEPGAGSDLAALRTSAVRDGDHYVVNGAKMWTTYAQYADWMFCLVRTDASGRKQQGITFLLFPMDSPGITVRPIITVDGTHEVNEVIFDNLRVPVENRVGEEGKGWDYAKYLLTHERTMVADVGRSRHNVERIKKIAAAERTKSGALIDDELFRRRLVDLEVELDALEYTELRLLSEIETGGAPGAESSILKIKGAEIQQAITEFLLEIAGNKALPFVRDRMHPDWDGAPVGPDYAGMAAPRYFNFRKASIYGGTNEIQKNIIAKAVLGL
ncbi:acyl-CoA dehydrogenase family protein [Roseovarius amoyensis]|uniref:acyl-CoA dehydrogenase family protein n=1 Tax=Roseovarius amoyensis TaxID=2211448 RepID=UPI000DBE1D58|nr:acyl-CoA dehydrogenase family protein [Roseovarius amoyensis]